MSESDQHETTPTRPRRKRAAKPVETQAVVAPDVTPPDIALPADVSPPDVAPPPVEPQAIESPDHASSTLVDPSPATAADIEELEIAIESVREQVAAAVEELEVEVRNHGAGQPGVQAIAAGALRLIRENLQRTASQTIEPLAKLVRENLSSDYLDPDFWKGIAMVLQYQVDEARGFIERRARGEYQIDSYGMDQEIVDLLRPFATFLYRTWWRVTTEGLEHVPEEGAALLLANHAGALPWDGAMIATAVLEEAASPRLVRVLHDRWLSATPLLAPALAAVGQVPAQAANVAQLLSEAQLICGFPEGDAALAKRVFNRYKLAKFSDGEYVRAALRAGAPIVPVAVVGAEEAYPLIGDAWPLARLLKLPFFPVTPLFPWMGLLGAIPLPSKWSIVFHPPLDTGALTPESADNPLLVAELNEQTRSVIQATLKAKLAERKSAFF